MHPYSQSARTVPTDATERAPRANQANAALLRSHGATWRAHAHSPYAQRRKPASLRHASGAPGVRAAPVRRKPGRQAHGMWTTLALAVGIARGACPEWRQAHLRHGALQHMQQPPGRIPSAACFAKNLSRACSQSMYSFIPALSVLAGQRSCLRAPSELGTASRTPAAAGRSTTRQNRGTKMRTTFWPKTQATKSEGR